MTKAEHSDQVVGCRTWKRHGLLEDQVGVQSGGHVVHLGQMEGSWMLANPGALMKVECGKVITLSSVGHNSDQGT